MPKVEFKFDINKDSWNYWDTANSKSHWGWDFTKNLRPELIEKLKGKKFEEVKEYLLILLNKGYSNDKEKNNAKLKEIEKSWRDIENEFFNILKNLMNKPICSDNFACYITTIGRCPYNIKEKWFMLNIFWDNQRALTTIAHELLHMQFYHYYEEELMGRISMEKFQDIKEALTVLLNIEFKDILKYEDKGYPSHEHLREFIVKQWETNKDFEVLIEKCVERF